MIDHETSMDSQLLEARETLAAALAAALAEPNSPLGQRRFEECSASLIKAWRRVRQQIAVQTDATGGLGELAPQRQHVLPLILWLGTEPSLRQAVHQHVFGLVISKQCPAYETEYSHTRDATYRAHQMADIAGFYGAFGVQIDPRSAERVDHVSLELEFVAFMLAKLGHAQQEDGDMGREHRELSREAFEGFVRHHVTWWMPTFGKCLELRVEESFTREIDRTWREPLEALAGVGRMVRAWSGIERRLCGIGPSTQIVAPQVETESEEMKCATCALSSGMHGVLK